MSALVHAWQTLETVSAVALVYLQFGFLCLGALISVVVVFCGYLDGATSQPFSLNARMIVFDSRTQYFMLLNPGHGFIGC